MRGRLINPTVVEIARYEPSAATYDPTYDEITTSTDEDGKIAEDRPEAAPVRLHAQVRNARVDELAVVGTSLDVGRKLTLTFHFRELEGKGLVDPSTGRPRLNVGDRILAFYGVRGGLLEKIAYPPGLYAVAAMGQTVGIGRSRNLHRMIFSSRSQGAPL